MEDFYSRKFHEGSVFELEAEVSREPSGNKMGAACVYVAV
jgi:hypothetical protein